MAKTSILINEIYPAISGESRFSGWPCTLVRLTGCHLRCVWCDSEHSFSGGQTMTVEEIMAEIESNGHRTVLVTGGEPLLQKGIKALLETLLSEGHRVLLETSGAELPPNALALAEVPKGIHRVVDIKAPASGIPTASIDWEGIGTLAGDDEIKIVCAGREDFEWARDLVRNEPRMPLGVRVALSPVQGKLEARDLAEWILEEKLDVCFQIQLHKVVWPDVERGV